MPVVTEEGRNVSVPDHTHSEFDSIRSLLGQLREDLGEHRGDVRESIARIEGSLQTMAAMKAGEHERLDAAISDVRHKAKNTEIVVGDLGKQLGTYPKADILTATVEQVTRIRNIAVGITIGSSVGGGLVASLIAQIIGGQ